MNSISLKAARINSNLSARRVADHIGVTPDTVYRWESGKSSPTIVQGKKLAELYGVSLDVIDFNLAEGSE